MNKHRFNQKKRKIAKEYARAKRRFFLIHLLIKGLMLILFLVSGLNFRLRNLLLSLTTNEWLLVFLYFVIFALVFELIILPLDFYEGFILEHRFSLSNQKAGSYFTKKLKASSLLLGLGGILIEILYLLLRNFPSVWWLLTTLAWSIFGVLLTHLAPILLIPIFYKLNPLKNEEIKERLIDLCRLADTKIKEVFTIDLSKETKKANAALVGLGNTRSIILADTLFEQEYLKEEIEGILAHELGHHHHRHIFKLISSGILFSFISFYLAFRVLNFSTEAFPFTSLYDVANLPLILLVLSVISLTFSPLKNGYSRHLEREADEFALNLTKNRTAFINNMIKLADQNLSELSPPWWFEFLASSHPAILKRIRFAYNYDLPNHCRH